MSKSISGIILFVFLSGVPMAWGESTLVDTQSQATSATISSEEIQNVPTGRNVRDILKLQPGSAVTQDNQGTSQGGTSQDLFLLDGVNQASGNSGSEIANQLPQVEIIRGNNQPLTSSALSGVISVITKDQFQQLQNKRLEKANLKLSIKDLKNALDSDLAKNNPAIRDSINDSLKNALDRLDEVNSEIGELDSQIQESLPRSPRLLDSPARDSGLSDQEVKAIMERLSNYFKYPPCDDDCCCCGDEGPITGFLRAQDTINWQGLGVSLPDRKSTRPKISIDYSFLRNYYSDSYGSALSAQDSASDEGHYKIGANLNYDFIKNPAVRANYSLYYERGEGGRQDSDYPGGEQSAKESFRYTSGLKGMSYREPWGERMGFGGPILVNGLFGKEPGVMVYDGAGVPVGGVTRTQAKETPFLAENLIGQAEYRSRNYFLGDIKTFGKDDWPRRWSGLDYTAISKNLQSSMTYNPYLSANGGTNNFSIPLNWKPKALTMSRLGMSYGDIGVLGGVVNDQLSAGATKENFWKPTDRCGTISFNEPVQSRDDQEDVGVVPNDPLYLRGSTKKSKVQKKAAVTATIGSILTMGGVTLGAGAGSAESEGPDVRDQWGIQKVGFTPKSDPGSAWNVIDGKEKNVLVAVIDSGLDRTHPDGPEYIWTNPKETPGNNVDDDNNGYADDIHGWNFIDNNSDLTDKKGHGTFVAGIIAAKANNGIGIAGINPGAEIMALKVGDHHGQASSLDIFRAIHYAVDNGARVINISLGSEGVSKLEQLAMNYAHRKGVLVVVAAGNSGGSIENFGPAASKRILSVGAIDYEGSVSMISNWGPNVSLVAPGELIYSLYSKDSDWNGPSADRERLYFTQSGTSFSSPMVAATASLLLAKSPGLTNADVKGVLLNSAKDLGEEGWDSRSGAGLLDASKALRFNPDDALTVELSALQVNEEKGNLKSVAVFGLVRGNLKDYVIEIGKGKTPSKWEAVAGPFKRAADYAWICTIDAKALQGNRDWHVRISATDKNGKTKHAQAPILSGAKKE